MGIDRDDFSSGVRMILAHRAGFCCSKPECRALTAGPSSEGPTAKSSVGIAAHITAAAPGGPRYDVTLTPEERQSVNNGIWLCQTHAKLVDDDVVTFTVDRLQGWKRHAEVVAQSLLGRPLSPSALDVSVQVAMHRASDDSLLVMGLTNLPDATKLFVELFDSARQGPPLGQTKATVSGGTFAAAGFTRKGAPHGHAWYVVEVVAYFNGPWRQADAVLDIVGREGEYLVGRFAEPLHPEFEESEKRLRASFSVVAPPLRAAPSKTKGELLSAIDIVKRAVLCVDGRTSALPVEGVVDLFLSTDGLRAREGWSARELPNGAIAVTLSFWNGAHPADADWATIPDTGEVRYTNIHGKYMSWAPDY